MNQKNQTNAIVQRWCKIKDIKIFVHNKEVEIYKYNLLFKHDFFTFFYVFGYHM